MNELENKILHKSAELFASLGVKVVTMDDVASSLGVSKKTIYKCFSTKKGLVERCFGWLSEEIEQIIAEVYSSDKNAVRKTIEIHFKIEKLFDSNDSCITQLSKYYPKIFEKVMKRQLDIIEVSLIENYQEGVEEGFYLEDLDAKLMSKFFYAMISTLGNESIFNKAYKHGDLHLENKLYYLRSITTMKGREELKKLQKEYKLEKELC